MPSIAQAQRSTYFWRQRPVRYAIPLLGPTPWSFPAAFIYVHPTFVLGGNGPSPCLSFTRGNALVAMLFRGNAPAIFLAQGEALGAGFSGATPRPFF